MPDPIFLFIVPAAPIGVDWPLAVMAPGMTCVAWNTSAPLKGGPTKVPTSCLLVVLIPLVPTDKQPTNYNLGHQQYSPDLPFTVDTARTRGAVQTGDHGLLISTLGRFVGGRRRFESDLGS